MNYINGLFKNRKNKVRYNITTNGTIVDERLLKLFQEIILELVLALMVLRKYMI